MIEKNIKTTEGAMKITIATDLSEVTLQKFIDLQAIGVTTNLEAVGILSGIPKEELYTVRNIDDFRMFKPTIDSLNHQAVEVFNGEIPASITFPKYGKFKPVKNLSVEPVGAYISVSELIEKEQEVAKAIYPDTWEDFFSPSLRSCLDILAHYFYSYVTGLPYTERGALDFTEVVKELPCTQALPIAKYFFLNYPHLTKQKVGFFQVAHQALKLKLGSDPSKNSDI